MNKNKLLIFGGSFNPVHNGHINLALAAQSFIDADKLIVLPTNISPHKGGNITSSFHRFNMCKMAFGKFDKTEVSDLEIKRGGISYTIDSLNEFRKVYHDSEIFLLVGSDMLINLISWKDANKIFKITKICAACRTYGEHEQVLNYSKFLQKMGAKVLIMDFYPFEVSSSEIRRKIKDSVSIRGLVPDDVFNYIIENKLYV